MSANEELDQDIARLKRELVDFVLREVAAQKAGPVTDTVKAAAREAMREAVDEEIDRVHASLAKPVSSALLEPLAESVWSRMQPKLEAWRRADPEAASLRRPTPGPAETEAPASPLVRYWPVAAGVAALVLFGAGWFGKGLTAPKAPEKTQVGEVQPTVLQKQSLAVSEEARAVAEARPGPVRTSQPLTARLKDQAAKLRTAGDVEGAEQAQQLADRASQLSQALQGASPADTLAIRAAFVDLEAAAEALATPKPAAPTGGPAPKAKAQL